MIAMIVPLV